MNLKTFIICLKLMLIPHLSYSNNLQSDICEKVYQKISSDRSLKTMEEKFKAFESQKDKCLENGIHQKYIANLYSFYDQHDIAKDILLSFINNSDSDKREHEEFLALIYYGNGSNKEHYELLNQMIKKYPDWYGGYYHLGLYFLNKQEWHLAKKSLLHALTLNKNKSQIYACLSIIDYQKNDLEKTISNYQKAYSLDPANTIWNRYSSAVAVISFTEKKDFKSAYDILIHQKKIDPAVLTTDRYKISKEYFEHELEKSGYSVADLERLSCKCQIIRDKENINNSEGIFDS